MALTVHGAILSAAARDPAATAIEHDSGPMTYKELEQRSAGLAAGLLGLGLEIGDRVIIALGNVPPFFVAAIACSRAGLVAVPVPAGVSERELSHFVEDSGAKALIAASDFLERLESDVRAYAADGLVVIGWDEAFAGAPVGRDLSERVLPGGGPAVDDERLPFFVGYTSGTTGRPKGAVISQRARTLLAMTLGQEYGCYHADARALIATPLYHGAGMNRAMAPLMAGGTVVLHERFDPERVDRLLGTGEVDSVFMVPTMFAAIQELDSSPTGDGRVTIMSNAAALPEKLKLFALDRWPLARLFEIYGSTEGGTISSLRPTDLLTKPRCVGQALAMTELRIVGPEGDELPRGVAGQLWSRSPYVFTEYLGRPEATAEVLTEDGFVTSGDVAVLDDEGYLFIVGRVTDTIITGGVNVFPREIEEVIREHPAVVDAVAIGIPDERWGERVHAVVIPKPGVEVLASELDAHCRGLLSSQKMPKGFDIRSEVPRTGTGKIVRSALVDEVVASQRESASDEPDRG